MKPCYSLVTFEAEFHYAGTRLPGGVFDGAMWVNHPPAHKNEHGKMHLTEDAIAVRAIAPYDW